jgi:membrane peptidoglycan carboxypeptidase
MSDEPQPQPQQPTGAGAGEEPEAADDGGATAGTGITGSESVEPRNATSDDAVYDDADSGAAGHPADRTGAADRPRARQADREQAEPGTTDREPAERHTVEHKAGSKGPGPTGRAEAADTADAADAAGTADAADTPERPQPTSEATHRTSPPRTAAPREATTPTPRPAMDDDATREIAPVGRREAPARTSRPATGPTDATEALPAIRAAEDDDATRRIAPVHPGPAHPRATPGKTPPGRTPGAPTTRAAALGAAAAGTQASAPASAAAGAAAAASAAAARTPAAGQVPAQAQAPGARTAAPEAASGAVAADGGGNGGDGGNGGSGGKAGKQPKRPKRTGWRRLIPTWRMVLGTFITGIVLLAGLFFLGYSMVKIPPANALATKQANVYLYADGTEIARDGEINRENVTLAQISKDAQHAVLAAEDRDFYSESAVDPKAMVRAGWKTVTGGGKQSGSTITQQYVKNYYLGQEQTVTRKVKEFFIAIKLDRNKSKDEILEGYLNTSFFGRNAYGIQAAARAYYGIDAVDLTAAQGAYLASLLNAPSEYDVVAHPENKAAAEARWNYVLDGMVKEGWLSASERATQKFPMPRQATLPTGMAGQRGYLVDAIKDYLYENKIVDAEELRGGGYRITTTLQKSKQDAFVKAVDDQLMSKLDPKENPKDRFVRAGGAAVEPKTGKVVAMYGGIDYVKQYTNNATRGDFQVGSTFKPFVFTSALENESSTQDGRTITPNTIYSGESERPVEGWNGDYYAPENEDGVNYGPITVREATDKSVNSVYAQMVVDVGPAKVKQTAIDLGIPADTKELNAYPSMALGTANASVLDMAEAYATLANHGKRGTYTLVEKISRNGQDMELPKAEQYQAVSREAADTTTAILQSVVDQGTATAAQAAGRPAAGKTGTAEKDQAAWFAGYTPELATVVSVMGQDPDTAAHKSLYGVMGLPRINGGGAPTEIWAQFTRDALKGKPVSEFDLELQEGAEETQAPPSTDPGDDSSDDDSDQDGGTTTGAPTGTPATAGQTGGQTPGQNQGQTGGGTDTGTTTGGTPATDGGTGDTADGGSTGDASTGGDGGGGDGGGTGDGANGATGGDSSTTFGTTFGQGVVRP